MLKIGQVENKNQFYYEDGFKSVFQSYNSIIVIYQNGKLIFGRDWDYSKTTLKHLYIYLNDYLRLYGFRYREELYKALKSNNRRKALQKMIDNGQIEYDCDLK